MSAPQAPTAAAVVATVDERWGEPCGRCSIDLIGHDVVMSLMLGFREEPCCAACLATAHGAEPGPFLARAAEQVSRLACYRAGWEHSDQRLEARGRWPEERFPSSLRLDGRSNDPPDTRLDGAQEARGGDAAPPESSAQGAHAHPRHAAEYDAGDKGCGELVLQLRVRMNELAPGEVLRLVAHDPGAPEDLPAWCRMTGHGLRAAEPPVYWIERKPN